MEMSLKVTFSLIYQRETTIKKRSPYIKRSKVYWTFFRTFGDLLIQPVFVIFSAIWIEKLNAVSKEYKNNKYVSSTRKAFFQASLEKNQGYVYQNFVDKRQKETKVCIRRCRKNCREKIYFFVKWIHAKGLTSCIQSRKVFVIQYHVIESNIYLKDTTKLCWGKRNWQRKKNSKIWKHWICKCILLKNWW